MKPLNVITLFSGYDSQCLALNRLGVPYDLAAWCEIDRHAVTAHNALFPQWKDRNLGDISAVDWEQLADTLHVCGKQIDLLTYSSPCQDFSTAGLQRGGDKGSGTRSSLLWEVEKAISTLRPSYLLFENVAALVSDKFITLFGRWQARLNSYGYTNFQQLMNARDYGVPQNRLRIFMVSVLDCQRAYYFPRPFPLDRRLKDILEHNVDESYFLKEETIKKMLRQNEKGYTFKFKYSEPPYGDIASTLTATHGWRREDNFIAEPKLLGWTRDEHGNITDRHPVSVANCVTAAKRDNTQNYVLEPCIAAMRGHDKDKSGNYIQRLEPKPDGTSNTLTSFDKDNLLIEPAIIDTTNMGFEHGGLRQYSDAASTLKSGRTGLMTTHGTRIRRLTERELYRLMDVEEHDIDTLLAAPIPRSQHAKLAGNSIVVACLHHIFRNLLLTPDPTPGTQTIIF